MTASSSSSGSNYGSGLGSGCGDGDGGNSFVGDITLSNSTVIVSSYGMGIGSGVGDWNGESKVDVITISGSEVRTVNSKNGAAIGSGCASAGRSQVDLFVIMNCTIIATVGSEFGDRKSVV
jgi:hypothetical protein